jgi:hypothetical protein
MASKKKTAAKAKKSGSTQTKSPYGTKTAFVMGLPREMSARDVVSKGKAQGIKLSEAHVYKIRSTSKAPAPKGAGRKAAAAPAKAKGRAAKAAPARKGGKAESGSGEARFIAAALDLGLSRASQLLSKLKGKLK